MTNGVQNPSLPASQQPQEDNPAKFEHTQISGRFNQYTSAYWALALPALGIRYAIRFVGKILDHGEVENKFIKPIGQNFGPLVGTYMSGLAVFYGLKTYKDMKTVLRETVAYENGKNKAEIGFFDLWKSENTIVRRTIHNSVKYTLRRVLVNLPFFFKPIANKFMSDEWRSKWIKDITPYDMADAGVATNMFYLATDVFSRKITFFEALQSFIDKKINHSDNVSEHVKAEDLMGLYRLHIRDNSPDEQFATKVTSPAWQNNQVLFGRMASLMNQSYGNQVKAEHADFTLPKLIYLLGHGLVKPSNMENSLAYIEVANRHGMNAVKKLQEQLEKAVPLEQAMQAFPVAPSLKDYKNEQDKIFLKQMGIRAEDAAGIASEADKLQKKPREFASLASTPASYQEQAKRAQESEITTTR